MTAAAADTRLTLARRPSPVIRPAALIIGPASSRPARTAPKGSTQAISRVLRMSIAVMLDTYAARLTAIAAANAGTTRSRQRKNRLTAMTSAHPARARPAR
jgi:hypothetical protein